MDLIGKLALKFNELLDGPKVKVIEDLSPNFRIVDYKDEAGQAIYLQQSIKLHTGNRVLTSPGIYGYNSATVTSEQWINKLELIGYNSVESLNQTEEDSKGRVTNVILQISENARVISRKSIEKRYSQQIIQKRVIDPKGYSYYEDLAHIESIEQ